MNNNTYMTKSQRVQSSLEEKDKLEQGSKTHSQIMETRAMQSEERICTIESIYTSNGFGYIGRYINDSVPFASRMYETREEAHKNAEKDNNVYKYGIRYRPSVTIELKFETGDIAYISFVDRCLNRNWDPESHFFHNLFELCSYSFEDIGEKQIQLKFNQEGDKIGKFDIMGGKNTSIKQKIHDEGYIEKHKDYNRDKVHLLSDWLNYIRKSTNGDMNWVKSTIKEVYTDGEDVSLLVNAPNNQTIFNISFSQSEDSDFWELVENIGNGDPLNLKNESVYLAAYTPFIRRDIDDYIAIDVEKEWVLKKEKPLSNTSSSLADKIREKFYLKRINFKSLFS